MGDNYEINTFTAKGIEIDYLKFGNGERNLIIIPGLSIKSVMESAGAVADAYNVFCEDYTVYLFDRNKKIKNSTTIYDMASSTAAAIHSLGIESADFFGVSQGGMIAQCIAVEYPELVHKMVLGSTLSKINKTTEKTLGEWIDLAKKKDIKSLCENFVKKLFSKDFCDKFGELIVNMNLDVTNDELERFICLASATDGFDIHKNLGKIKCPVLILGAENDKVVTGEASKQMHEKFPNSEIYMYGGDYGHGVYDEAPDYKTRILEFLKK